MTGCWWTAWFRCGRAWLHAWLVVAWVAGPGPVSAAEQHALPIVIHVVGELRQLVELEQRISSWLPEGQSVTVVGEAQLVADRVLDVARNAQIDVWLVPGRPPAGGSGQSDAPAASDQPTGSREVRIRLYFAVNQPPASPRYLTRTVTLEHGLDEVGAEQLAQIVASSAQALARGEATTSRELVSRQLQRAVQPSNVAAASAEANQPGKQGSQPDAEPPRPEERPLLGAGLGAEYRGVDGWLVSPQISAAVPWTKRWLVRSTLRLDSPRQVTVSDHSADSAVQVPVDLLGWGVELGALYRVSSGRWSFRLGGHFGLDWVHFAPARHAGDWQVRPVTAVELRGVRTLEWGEVWLAMQGRVLLSDPHYRIETEPGVFERLQSPARLSPSLALGVNWFLGAGR